MLFTTNLNDKKKDLYLKKISRLYGFKVCNMPYENSSSRYVMSQDRGNKYQLLYHFSSLIPFNSANSGYYFKYLCNKYYLSPEKFIRTIVSGQEKESQTWARLVMNNKLSTVRTPPLAMGSSAFKIIMSRAINLGYRLPVKELRRPHQGSVLPFYSSDKTRVCICVNSSATIALKSERSRKYKREVSIGEFKRILGNPNASD